MTVTTIAHNQLELLQHIISKPIFQVFVFPSTISEGYRLNLRICKSKTLLRFSKRLPQVGRPEPNSIYNNSILLV